MPPPNPLGRWAITSEATSARSKRPLKADVKRCNRVISRILPYNLLQHTVQDAIWLTCKTESRREVPPALIPTAAIASTMTKGYEKLR